MPPGPIGLDRLAFHHTVREVVNTIHIVEALPWLHTQQKQKQKRAAAWKGESTLLFQRGCNTAVRERAAADDDNH